MRQNGQAVLLTGGLGYIGSHTAVVLSEAGYTPVLLDNLSNCSRDVHHAIEMITGRLLPFVECDVRKMVKAFEQASGRCVPCKITSRRPGDVASCYADPQKAKRLLGWEAKLNLAHMCETTWRFQQRHGQPLS